MSQSSSAPATDSEALTHRQIMVIMSGLLLGMLLAALDQTCLLYTSDAADE